jgi:hypothetical protein
MSTKRPSAEKRTDDIRTDIRPAYYDLGTDERGRDHLWSRRMNTIEIILPDGSRKRRHVPAHKTVDDYVELVADEGAGWADQRYGGSLVGMLADSVDADSLEGE